MKVNNQVKKIFISMIAALSLTGCANDILNQGSAVSNTSKDTQQNHVKLYYGNSGLPKHYKVVGRVSAENYNLFAMENSQADIAQELKNQAASIGANGVMNISTGLAQTTGDAIVRK